MTNSGKYMLLAILTAAVILTSVTFPAGRTDASEAIPDRPEKLEFPPLMFNPPIADSFRVVLSNGIRCYMMQDRKVPLIDVTVYVEADKQQVPRGLEGLNNAVFELLDSSGTSHRDADRFGEDVAYLGAKLYSYTNQFGGELTLNCLSKDSEAGLDLLFEALREPAFQEDRVAIWKRKNIANMKTRNDETSSIERMEFRRLLYAFPDPIARFSTKSSIESITIDDMKKWHDRWVVPGNILIVVTGDFETSEMKALLEKETAGWMGSRVDVPELSRIFRDTTPGIYVIHKDVNQSRVSFALPGPDRYSPEWLPASCMIRIFGNNGLNSRLLNRIRTKEGLAYSIYAYLDMEYSGPSPIKGYFQTKTESTVRAMELTVEEMHRMVEEGVTEDELKSIIDARIEGLPQMFSTASRACNILAREELSGRWKKDPGYYSDFAERIRKVTIDQVNDEAGKLLKPGEMIWLVVGDTTKIFKGDGRRDLEEIGPVKILPLHDPLTQEVLHK